MIGYRNRFVITIISEEHVMVWEWIATLFAGLGAAGIMLGLKRLFQKIPKWAVPAGAGLGMMLFQVYSEYTWYGHTRSLLPPGTEIVAEIPETAVYKPWSYIKPQVLKFVAVDTVKTIPVNGNGDVVQANLYFFERRMSANTWPVLVDCRKQMQANVKGMNNGTPEPDGWVRTPYTGKIAKSVCK